jgi:hypothetical protein
MQTTPSALVTGCIIGIDVLLSVVEIKRYVDRRSVVPTIEIIQKAIDIIPSTLLDECELSRCGTRHTRGVQALITILGTSLTQSRSNQVVPVVASPGGTTVECFSSPDNDKIIVVHAREILQSAEVIMLIEYFEVSVPFMSACLLLVASQLPSALYNTTVRPFHLDPSKLAPAVGSIFLYTSLQAITLLGMFVAMQIRYRLSAIKLLAFVLEAHVWSLQAKLLMWLTAALSLPITHYGWGEKRERLLACWLKGLIAVFSCMAVQVWISRSSSTTKVERNHATGRTRILFECIIVETEE